MPFQPSTKPVSPKHQGRFSHTQKPMQPRAGIASARCDARCSVLRWPTEHAAWADATRCVFGGRWMHGMFLCLLWQMSGVFLGAKIAFRNLSHPSCRQKALLLQKASWLKPWCRQIHPGRMPSEWRFPTNTLRPKDYERR